MYSVYKNFRDSQDGLSIICDAAQNAKKILSLSELHDVPASKLSMVKILNSFSSASLDFNDAVFVDICKNANLKLMTHDKDFNSIGLEILTVNDNLLTRNAP